MTLVHFHLADAEGRGLDGSVSLVPTRRVTVRDAIRLPVAQTVRLDKGEATVEVMPSTTQWVWRVSELVAAGGRRYVEVPDSAQMVEYAGLVDVDPATLDQSSETVAAWETVTRAAQSALDQIESINDKVTRAERSAQAAKASEGVAGQESTKAADASAKALASQMAAASSASLAHEAESAAARSATAASNSAANAKDSETAASASAASAAADAQSANTSANTATGKAHDAAISADKAKASETAAKTSETVSAEHADTASAAASEAEKTLEQLRRWFPAATMRTDLWMEPVDFAVDGPYAIPDQPTISLKPVAAYLDGHTSDVDASMASRDAAVATLDGQTLTWVSNPTTLLAALKSDGYQPAEVTIKAGDTTVTKHVYLQADQPDGVVGDLWVRTEKLHNGLRYYTGAYGTAAADANSMFFLVDRPREIWRKTIDGWKLLTGKELS
ncbi:hypothetical protein [uncultured Bifidobacterium sp.]|uniref:hypothetical protein n=1 Tax=uncultured Bifidobacterium sp. TaxID=165187 RepID=UPI0025852AC9|nr:hypothetical protein [uncultured Bifidobacterium sp.]